MSLFASMLGVKTCAPPAYSFGELLKQIRPIEVPQSKIDVHNQYRREERNRKFYKAFKELGGSGTSLQIATAMGRCKTGMATQLKKISEEPSPIICSMGKIPNSKNRHEHVWKWVGPDYGKRSNDTRRTCQGTG